jgi:orotidine-5'-phosphate decarboxylase
MGEDSVTPFLEYKHKWVILLALTSNAGSKDFQIVEGEQGKIYEQVLKTSTKWGNPDNMMYVVGATKAEMLEGIRKIVPENFLLVPGVGAQGGSLAEVVKYGMNKQCGLLVNSSRGIIYAGSGADFAVKAREEAIKLQKEMSQYLNNL